MEPFTLTVKSGLMVPVFSGALANDPAALRALEQQAWKDDGTVPEELRGSKGFVGFVLVDAEIDCELHWTERADHLIFANHMVRNMGRDRSDFVDVAQGEPWDCSATEALVLGVGEDIRSGFLGPDPLVADPFEIVVYGDKPRQAALARAKAILQARTALMDEVGLSPGRRIAQTRVEVGRGVDVTQFALVDVHVDTPLGLPHIRDKQRYAGVDWLLTVRDRSGGVNTRRHTQVMTLDRTASGVGLGPLTGIPFPPQDPDDPHSAPVAPVRMEAQDAYVKAYVMPKMTVVHAEIVARLQLMAVGGAVQSFELSVPRMGNRTQFEVLDATLLDGTRLLASSPLVAHDRVLGVPDEDEDEGDAEDAGGDGSADPKPPKTNPYLEMPESTVTLVLPEPLPAGESVVVDVRWKDVWGLAQTAGDLYLGNGGRFGLLPRLGGTPPGNPSKFRLSVHLPEELTTAKVALSGENTEGAQEPGWTSSYAGHLDSRVPFASAGLGYWQTANGASVDGLPRIRVHMRNGQEAVEFVKELRRQIWFLQGYLPKYPWPELEMMESAPTLNGYTWVALHGLTELHRTVVSDMSIGASLTRVHGRHLGQHIAAHETAHQWWGHLVQPAHTSDFWIAETMAESYAWIYTAAVRDIYEEGFADKRQRWEQDQGPMPPRASLTDAYSLPQQPGIVYNYGPVVFQEMLRPRLGHERYHAGLDVLMRELAYGPVTTEQLKHYLELASEQDLTDFFDFWVYCGHIPERIEAELVLADGLARVHMTTDVPFGRFDVPVRIDGRDHTVSMVDGRGLLELPWSGPAPSVEVDPEGRVLAVKRVVRDAP